MAAVGACVADDELQLLPGVLHELPLERSLLRLGGPGEALVHIEQPIKAKGESNQPPAHGLPDLQQHKDQQITRLSSHTDIHPNNGAQSIAKSAHYTQMEDQRRKQGFLFPITYLSIANIYRIRQCKCF